MALCRLRNATLVIAKIDRLSRDAYFLLGLQKAGVRFVAADMPEANEMVVGVMAVVVQAERKMISARTKAALQAAKARGKKLGGLRHRLVGRLLWLAAGSWRSAASITAGTNAAGSLSCAAFLRAARRQVKSCVGVRPCRWLSRKRFPRPNSSQRRSPLSRPRSKSADGRTP
jgi:hypothetical protein